MKVKLLPPERVQVPPTELVPSLSDTRPAGDWVSSIGSSNVTATVVPATISIALSAGETLATLGADRSTVLKWLLTGDPRWRP